MASDYLFSSLFLDYIFFEGALVWGRECTMGAAEIFLYISKKFTYSNDVFFHIGMKVWA